MQAALSALTSAHPPLAEARRIAGALPDRRRAGGFAALLMLIVEQQVSIASARAIWGRMLQGIDPMDAETVATLSSEELCGLGLSRPKARYALALAEAVLSGDLPLERLHEHSDDEAMAALTSVTGIGQWTAEVYLLFSLGRTDVFPAGDVALQAAAGDILGLPDRPNAKELAALAENWRPHRGVAAQLLWRYYGVTRGRADPVAVDHPLQETGT
ncbi:MAG: DNA-3-methyladenine glycosylase family protein [Minwuia sp.]|uniref:DNA-3-methyladenine glycosylase family protein n=1 Tax=Minwuia sp. TaxID=2493630 RepID=UPI003A86BEAA